MLFGLSDDPTYFPPLETAFENGLLAYGGDLSPQRLLCAYKQGIFPWYDNNKPILWWSPDPRCILLPENFRIPKRIGRELKKCNFSITMNKAFTDVITACAILPREKQKGTWITQEMKLAYIQLHKLGFSHSVEVWDKTTLIGGLYGVVLGKAFFGESMFHIVPHASKVALVWLAQKLWSLSFEFIDCQMPTTHIMRYGAKLIPRSEFLIRLKAAITTETNQASTKEAL